MADVRLIDANKLMKKSRRMYAPDEIDSMAPVATNCVTVNDIHRAPVVDAVPVVHGKWEICWEDWRHQLDGNKCSVCGFEYFGNLFKYCPDCGEKMDGGAEG